MEEGGLGSFISHKAANLVEKKERISDRSALGTLQLGLGDKTWLGIKEEVSRMGSN
jgi:hypothetical protein